MPERINHPPQSPSVLLPHREDLGCASRPRLAEDSIRIGYSQYHSNRAATERFGTEVAMLGRLVTQPKLGAINGKSCHHAPARVFEAKDLRRSECGLVEVDGSRTIANRKPRRDRGPEGAARCGICDRLTHARVCTSTESTAGRSRTIGFQLSPASAEAYTCPPLVPK